MDILSRGHKHVGAATLTLQSVHLFALVLLLMKGSDSASWWQMQNSGLDTNLRGVSVKPLASVGKDQYVVWASGSNGVVLRSSDEGKTWVRSTVPGGNDLDFRDIEAFDADTAYLMSSGDGQESRIYKTTDGGNTWKLQYSDERPGFFLDSLACSSKTACFAVGDPIGGKFVVLRTDDGEHWTVLPTDKMPAALPQEGAFAASGTAIALCTSGVYFGTGGPQARVFHSANQGRSWKATKTPMTSGNASSGIFSLACTGRDNLVAVGGDYKDPDGASHVAIRSADAAKTWRDSDQQPGGFRSGVGWFSQDDVAAVGPNGTDVSHDGGIHWRHTDQLNLNAISFAGAEGWAVGPKGAIARFTNHVVNQGRGPSSARSHQHF